MYSGFCDANGQQLIVGDTVLVCGIKGSITFWCGAYGIQFDDDASRLLFEASFKAVLGHEPHLMHNETMDRRKERHCNRKNSGRIFAC